MPEPIEALQEIMRGLEMSAGVIRDLIEASQILERRLSALEHRIYTLEAEVGRLKDPK